MRPLYTFYGDDFTGSTDVLEQLAANGVPSVLFLSEPTPEQLSRFPGVLAFGIAGESRSRSPEWMATHLPPIFEALRKFGAPIVHYKVCSTFDSSPDHGSIGCAIELGLAAFDPPFVPIVVGAPHLRRFVLDGNLFAAAPDGRIHRIDRHPMSHHPVTPMREPDLRKHLALQTRLAIGLVANEAMHDVAAASAELDRQLDQGQRAVLFDTVDAESLNTCGTLLWERAQTRPLFSASSSGLTAALIGAWRGAGLLAESATGGAPSKAAPLLVVSGSCSPVTALQIRWALANGFSGVSVDPAKLLDGTSSARRHLLDSAVSLLSSGQDTVIYTALDGPTSTLGGEMLGSALGYLMRDILDRTSVQRVLLCGGDTSSHAVQQLNAFALTWVASLQTGAPLCRAHFINSDSRPLELILKGGQVGTEDFFVVARGE